MLDKKVEGLKREDETDRFFEKHGIVIDRSLSNKEQKAAFKKEVSRMIDSGEASSELQFTYQIMELYDESERMKRGQRIKFGKAAAKAKREQSA